jgi:nitroreductase
MTTLENDIHPLIRTRWSSRAMDPDKPVPLAVIDQLLEAARWAPSSRNRQPWRYLVFDERVPEARARARDCLRHANQIWAIRAPVLLLAVAKVTVDDGRANEYAKHDIGMANENLLLQAIALGLSCRPMAGFNHEKAQRSFNIPEGYEPMVIIAVGYPGAIEELPREVQEKQARPRERHSIEDVAFHGDWGFHYQTSS